MNIIYYYCTLGRFELKVSFNILVFILANQYGREGVSHSTLVCSSEFSTIQQKRHPAVRPQVVEENLGESRLAGMIRANNNGCLVLYGIGCDIPSFNQDNRRILYSSMFSLYQIRIDEHLREFNHMMAWVYRPHA